MFNLDALNKQWVLKTRNKIWNNWKSEIRCKVYDRYPTDAERKLHIPSLVKKEDWETFLEMQLTEEIKSLRKNGKNARKALKGQHTSGRKGQARVAAELRLQNPDKEITRTDVYIATYTKKDGSASGDHMVYGLDRRGRVHGMGSGVSKTILKQLHPYRHALEEQKSSNASFKTKIEFTFQKIEIRLQEEEKARRP